MTDIVFCIEAAALGVACGCFLVAALLCWLKEMRAFRRVLERLMLDALERYIEKKEKEKERGKK